MPKRKSKMGYKRKSSRKSKKVQHGGKKPLNDYFKAMLKAKKEGVPSFKYKNSTYKKKEGKNGMVFYKKV